MDGRSALVRLSDSIKIGLDSCARAASAAVEIYDRYELPFREARLIAERRARGELSARVANVQVRRALSAIPDEEAIRGANWTNILHSQALSTILTCCFCIESYSNSFAHYLATETDILREGNDGASLVADILRPGERMSTSEKWQALGRLAGDGFDKSRTPFQDFVCLFNFRDDHVHDKVHPQSIDRATERYNKHLPDPVLGMLDIGHVLFAAEVYWNMVEEVHRLTSIPRESFHRHYNLQPWRDSDQKADLVQLSASYRSRGLSPF